MKLDALEYGADIFRIVISSLLTISLIRIISFNKIQLSSLGLSSSFPRSFFVFSWATLKSLFFLSFSHLMLLGCFLVSSLNSLDYLMNFMIVLLNSLSGVFFIVIIDKHFFRTFRFGKKALAWFFLLSIFL